ncbi:hypothetical protein [Nonomuraea candida]|uniref:hypothetical protein n=1 Tax=Nonomuraea candida TaxID=359159 RepID=UPI0005B77C93|nr:hypothetical protein [Nonomuraea candida]
MAVVAGSAMGTQLMLSTPAPAWAAEHDGWCTYAELCVFEHENRAGGRHDYYNEDDSYDNDYLYYFWGSSPVISGTPVNDMTSSLSNGDDRCKAVLREHSHGGGLGLIIPYDTSGSGYVVNDLVPYGMNDFFSSHRWQDCF